MASCSLCIFVLHVFVIDLLACGASAHRVHHERSLQRFGQTREKFSQFDNLRDWVESEDFRLEGARCATSDDENSFLAAERVYQKWIEENPCPSCFQQSTERDIVEIGTVWHIIQRSDGSEGISQQNIEESMQVLNAAFSDVGFRFVLEDVTTSMNDDWWNALPQQQGELDMKSALRRGDCAYMNIYSKSGGGILGWATFPIECSADMSYDGVVIDYQTVPGGAMTPYDEGDTLTHEVGHWMGLFHTFQGGCGRPNDYVADTNPESEPDYECDLLRDSCQDGGLESITNFMNYGPDSCLERWSDEQLGRMHAQHSAFRFNTGENTPAPDPTPSAPTPGGSPTTTPTACPPICFSGAASVPVQHVGPTQMSQIKTGDKILTARGYEPIYGFAHDNRRQLSAPFLQIHTKGQDRPLEISEEHLVFVAGKTHPTRASSIGIGDVLISENTGAVVTKVNMVKRNGVYAPLTASGTIVVDGILSSCYVSLPHARSPVYMELQGGISTQLSHHFLVHIWLAPVRIMCIGISSIFCHSFDSETGLAHFVRIGFRFADFIGCKHFRWQLPLLMLYLLVLGPISLLEWLAGPAKAVYVLMIGVGLVLVRLLRIERVQLAFPIAPCKQKKIN